MINTRIPKDPLFNYAECEELYNLHKDKLRDGNFEDIVNNTIFYSFHIALTGELLGCIYYYERDNKTFVNVFANRGHHRLNLECFKKSLEWMDGDIYAEATERTSRIGVLRCGFERVKDNLFIYRRNK
jgi:hypothetical protein